MKDLVTRVADLEHALEDLLTTEDSGALSWLDYSATSTIVGWSSTTTKLIYYRRLGKMVFVFYCITGTSNSVNTSFTLPVVQMNWGSNLPTPTYIVDNSAGQAAPGLLSLQNGSNLAVCYKDWAGTAWTASGTKTILGSFWYVVA